MLMLSSAFLFHGENSYTLNTQLTKWKASFVEKYGADALFEFTNQNRDSAQLQQALYAGGLFVSKKMIICYGVPKDTYETNTLPAEKIESFFDSFQRNAPQLSEDMLVIFVSYKPDKRTKAFKRCNDNLQIKEFSLYKEAQLKTFITEQLAPLSITDDLCKYLLLKVGNDMYRLESECQKLKI
ncbi:MAG: hypothetical protein Q4B28_01500 [bacterium]|nr:hypothetical protein [bacterium]